MCCFASVKEVETAEINLLFKSLVVLPEDRATPAPAINTEVTTEKKVNFLKSEETKVETPTASKPSVIETPAPKENSSAAEDPEAVYVQHPIVILTTPELKKAYLNPGSNFLKTLDALSIQQLSKHLNTDRSILKNANHYTCIWSIGLDIQTEKKILSAGHENLLCSPDFNSLKTTEEKKAMFLPLREFLGANSELISKL